MANSETGAIGAIGSKPVSPIAPINPGADDDASNALADSLSSALTSGGRASFANPGARDDFQSGMRSAMADIMGGAKSRDNDQIMKGVTAMLGLLEGMSKAQNGDGQNKSEPGDKADGAQKAGGGCPPGGAPAASSGEDKKKKLLELIQMLMAMGVPPEMIQQLMQAMGMSDSETQQLMGQAAQGTTAEAPKTGGAGADPSRTKDAIPA